MIRSRQTAVPEMEKKSMNSTKIRMAAISECGLARMVTFSACVLLVMGCARLSFAQESGPKLFSSPAEAAHALLLAVQNNDEQAVGAILGAGREVTSSSEEVEDKLERERFALKYQEMHRLVRELDGRTVLYIGAENWPFPIPLVAKNGRWYFDSDAGTQEILFRRVGENETTAIQVCQAFAMAKKQLETKATDDDPIPQYARSLVSSWAANADNASSGLDKEPSAFRGYYFRIVTADSAAEINSQVSGGEKTRDLSLVAYPADYLSSGVMTFVVTQAGGVYEKNLGTDTMKLAPTMKERSSDSGWHVME